MTDKYQRMDCEIVEKFLKDGWQVFFVYEIGTAFLWRQNALTRNIETVAITSEGAAYEPAMSATYHANKDAYAVQVERVCDYADAMLETLDAYRSFAQTVALHHNGERIRAAS